MAHFAKLDENNTVINVIVLKNPILGEPEKSFPETEAIGQDFINNTLGLSGVYKQTSYNGNFRKNYARIGGIYDPVLDAFINPKPYPSWTLNSECKWEPPVPAPKPPEDKDVIWNESTLSWVVVP